MNKILCLTIVLSCYAAEIFAAPMAARDVSLGFQGKLLDSAGLSIDKPVNIEARFYKSLDRNPADLLYAERFDAVDVEKGSFRISLFKGIPIDGTVFDINALQQNQNVYVDMTADGTLVLDGEPMLSQFSAVRAETALKADALTQPLSLSAEDLPEHSADLISSGTLLSTAVPVLSGGKITTGTFGNDRIPKFSTAKLDCSAAKFSESTVPSGIDAAKFTSEAIPSRSLPTELFSKSDFAVQSGVKSHGEAVGIPAGFTAADCVWMVSLRKIENTVGGSDFGIDQLAVDTDANGVITCKWDPDEGDQLRQACRVSYLTICKK